MASSFTYVHRASSVSTNRFDYPLALDEEDGGSEDSENFTGSSIDEKGVNHSKNSVPRTDAYAAVVETGKTAEGAKITETIKPRLYFSENKDRQVLYPKSIFNDFCAVNYATIGGGIPALGSEINEDFLARYSDYDNNIKDNTAGAGLAAKTNKDATSTGDQTKTTSQSDNGAVSFKEAQQHPTIDNIIHFYKVGALGDQTDPHKLRSYDYTDFAFLTRLNECSLNRMITLRRYPTPCGDGMIDLHCPPDLTCQKLGVWETYGCVAKAVTFMDKENGNTLDKILNFSYGSNWEEETADIEEMTANTTLKSQLANRSKTISMSIAAARMVENGARGLSPMKANFASSRVYQGDALVDKYGKGVLGPINCIDKVNIRKRGLSFDHTLTLAFEYTFNSVAFMNPRAVAVDILANFLTLTGNYGEFWGGATRWHSKPEDLGRPVGDINALRNGDVVGFGTSVAKSFMGTLNNIFSGSLTDVLQKVGSVVAGSLAGHLSDMMERLSPIGTAQVTKALLANTPTGNWHLVIGNPLNPIAVIGNLCVDKVQVEWPDMLQFDDFPSSVVFKVSLKHGMPRDIGSIQTMFNMGKGRIYTDIDPLVIDAMTSSDAKTGKVGIGKNYHSLFAS